MYLLSSSSHTTLSFGCFVPENPVIDYIECMIEQFQRIIPRVP